MSSPLPSRPTDPLPTAAAPSARPKRVYQHIYFQVLVGVVLGVLVGYLRPGWGVPLKPLGDGFVNLIKMLIAPIIFTTVVAGIAKVGDLGKVGRVGLKALVYFEVVTTLAMVIGLGVVHAIQPGKGLPAAVVKAPASGKDAEKVKEYEEKGKKQNAVDFVLHVIPNTVVSAFSEGEILQVLLVSVLVGAALARMGAPAAPLVHAVDLTAQAFMTVVGFVVRLAPLAAFGAMAYTVGSAGLPALVALAKLMAAVYLTCLLFVFVVLELIMRANGFSLWRYLRYIKEEILLVLGTSSSESALPPLIAKLERVGCAKNVVGIVLPAGYSFNLDGTSIYLVMATVFISQATNTPLTWGQELFLLGILLLTSKGAAAVTGGGFITLAATISATGALPVAGLAPLIGIDRFMSEARAITNLIGNGVATLVVAKSEGELDYGLAAPVLLRPRAGTGTGTGAEPGRREALAPASTGANGAPPATPRLP